MLLKRIPKPEKRTLRWKSQAHLGHVRQHACVYCGSVVNVQAAHLRMGTDAGMGRKSSDFFATPLCGPNGDNPGCHAIQHQMGEPEFWAQYASLKGHTVDDVIAELIRTSPKRLEIEQVRKERGI